VPYWTGQAGQQQIAINLDSLNEVSPFSYELVGHFLIIDRELFLFGACNRPVGPFPAPGDGPDSPLAVQADPASRDRYLHVIEDVARRSRRPETAVAELAIAAGLPGRASSLTRGSPSAMAAASSTRGMRANP